MPIFTLIIFNFKYFYDTINNRKVGSFMQIANELKKHKKLLLIAGIIIAIVFAITLFKTFSETVTDDGWDGVVARTFTSGTGTEENPFVIANASEYAYFKQVMEGDDVEAIKQAQESLTQAFYKVSEKLYQNANPNGAAGAGDAGAQNGGATTNEDGTVNGTDYKVE